MSDRRATPGERRREPRRAADGFPLLSPAEAKIVDCAARGVGIETAAHLVVGSVASVDLFLPAGEVTFRGRVCWARLVGHRRRGGESRPVFRAGLCLDDEPALEAWERLRSRLITPRNERRKARPKRRIIFWRRPRRRAPR